MSVCLCAEFNYIILLQGDIEFSISMGYNDLECNVQREREGVYTNQVIRLSSYRLLERRSKQLFNLTSC